MVSIRFYSIRICFLALFGIEASKVEHHEKQSNHKHLKGGRRGPTSARKGKHHNRTTKRKTRAPNWTIKSSKKDATGQHSQLSALPSEGPEDAPSKSPTEDPSARPSHIPSDVQSAMPSDAPSKSPTEDPSARPSHLPSDVQSAVPSDVPSDLPSAVPSGGPEDAPSKPPTEDPSAHPSHFPTDVQTTMPSDVPSDLPSEDLSGYPSAGPTSCIDVQYWAQPDDSVWSGNILAGQSCIELTDFVPMDQPAEIHTFCEFLSTGIYSNYTAIDACCFCGGGKHTLQEPHCENMQWNEMKDTGGNLNCKFVDALPEDKRSNFCLKLGEVTFSTDGLTVTDACCACGGGEFFSDKSAAEKILKKRRHLQEDGSEIGAAIGAAGATTVLPDGRAVIDFTYRVGAGDSPGIPNLEYLGLGYDILRGNPRGSESSELDPGFRYSVLRLRQVQTDLTVDGQYTVPLGTAIKYTSSCKYDDSSVEISSESDMRKSLSKEANSNMSVSASASGGVSTPIKSFEASVSSSYSFSKSEKFESTSETNSQSSSVSFEARAVCSEFEASFIPGYDHELTPGFQKALDNLPVPYNKDNKRHRRTWDTFFGTFGSNYVRHLILGGKRIYSTSMTQEDYTSLVSESVDVESTMNFEMSAAVGASSQVKAGLVKGVASVASAFGGPQAAITGNIVNTALQDVDNDEVLFGANVNVATDTSLGQFASSKEQAESALKISNKKTTTREDTVGGLPYEDWRAWAGSVKEKPMPIKYELGSLMEFMYFEQTTAFIAAFEDLYGINTARAQGEPFLKGTVHHGVYTGQGVPLSLHSMDLNDDSSVLMKNNVAGFVADASEDYEFASGYPGRCADSEGRVYSMGESLMTYDKVEAKHFKAFCRKYPYFADHVGIDISTSPAWVQGTCLYDYGKGMELIKKEHPGTGPVAGGTGKAKDQLTTCYPNQNFHAQSKIFTFSAVWKTKSRKPTALFATPIRDTIAPTPDSEEGNRLPFSLPGTTWKNSFNFVLTNNLNSAGVLAVTSFGSTKDSYISNSNLPSFSFVTVDSLRKFGDKGEDLRSGIVDYNGMMLSEEGRDAFDVTLTSTSFRMKFSNYVYTDDPTVLAMPNWFSVNEEFLPSDVADLNFSIGKISKTGFTINHTSGGLLDEVSDLTPKSHLGFNFLVIGPKMPVTNIKHGIIYECTSLKSDTNKNTSYGISVSDGTCSSIKTQQFKDGTHNGVTVSFDSPFTDIPSVIVTPFLKNIAVQMNWTIRCVVEAITKSYAIVKCGLMDEYGYTPIPFTFVAVGN